jgi:transposase-like protein
MARARKYPEELLERGTRLVFESGRPIAHVARDLGIDSETLRKYVRRTEADEGKRKDLLPARSARRSSSGGCENPVAVLIVADP